MTMSVLEQFKDIVSIVPKRGEKGMYEIVHAGDEQSIKTVPAAEASAIINQIMTAELSGLENN
ncbi:MAG: hypothetical protein WBK55_09260 [Alphaproteobacteria bacterium]